MSRKKRTFAGVVAVAGLVLGAGAAQLDIQVKGYVRQLDLAELAQVGEGIAAGDRCGSSGVQKSTFYVKRMAGC